MSRRAACFGMNYKNSKFPLNGCTNDAKFLGAFLRESNAFDKVDIFTDDTVEGKMACCRKRMLEYFRALADSKPKFVFLHFSGHGTQTVDKNGEELDGKDECLVTADLQVITDDEMRQFISSFDESVSVTIVADCCHSGTIVDPPIVWEDEKVYTCEASQGNLAPIRCNLITLSGCRDVQTSADVFRAYAKSAFSMPGGALTSTLLECVQNNSEQKKKHDAFELLRSVRQALAKKGFTQKPVLGTSRNILTGSPDLKLFFPLAPKLIAG